VVALTLLAHGCYLIYNQSDRACGYIYSVEYPQHVTGIFQYQLPIVANNKDLLIVKVEGIFSEHRSCTHVACITISKHHFLVYGYIYRKSPPNHCLLNLKDPGDTDSGSKAFQDEAVLFSLGIRVPITQA